MIKSIKMTCLLQFHNGLQTCKLEGEILYYMYIVLTALSCDRNWIELSFSSLDYQILFDLNTD